MPSLIEPCLLAQMGMEPVHLIAELLAASESASCGFIRWLHREFYLGPPEAMLTIEGAGRRFRTEPGALRSAAPHDVALGRHVSPGSDRTTAFMAHSEQRYRLA